MTSPARSSGPSRRLIEPADYAVAAAKALREPPFDAAKVGEVYAAYERVKRAQGVIDFEDMIRAAIWAMEEHEDVAEQIRSQYRHFVVDEYQDVNPMQQRLLEAWLGDRDDLTVVGDASQTIYSFTGASASYLVDFKRRHPGRTVVRLIRDYRSTPQVVGLANSVIGQARGELARLRLELIGQRPPGPEPTVRRSPTSRRRPPPSPPAAASSSPRARRPRRSPCCSGSTPSPRSTRRRSRRPGCPTWCTAPSGSSSGPRSGRR